MSKLTIWTRIGLFSFLILFFSLFLAIFIPDIFIEDRPNNDSFIVIFVFLIIISLFFLGLVNSIKKLSKKKNKNTISYTNNLDITFDSLIEYKDYRKIIIALTFKKTSLFVFIGIFSLILINLYTNSEYFFSKQEMSVTVLVISIILITFPFLLNFQLSKIYKSNKVLNERINYNLNNETLKINGSSFNSELKWNHFYKAIDTKNFLVLYQGKNVAVLLDKKQLKSDEVNELKTFLKSTNLLNNK